MISMDIFCFKLLFYLLFFHICFGRAIEEKQDIDRNLSTKNAIYKKFLQMRTLPFEDCGSSYDILYLSISDCSSIPCQMKRGSTVLVNIIFDDHGKNTSFLKHHVTWIFNAIRTDAIISPDPCDGDHQCLTNQPDGKTYFSTVLVENDLALIRGTMHWEAFDINKKSVICFRIPIVIVKS